MSFLSRFKGSSKSSKSSPNSPNPSINSSTNKPLPVLAPLKLSLPSTSLLDSNGPSPLPSPSPATSNGAGDNGVPKSSTTSTTSSAWIKVDVASVSGVSSEEKAKLARTTFNPDQVNELVVILKEAIQTKGLTTLGLMRPFRTKEDERAILGLEKAWTEYCSAAKESKEGKFDAFKEEVKWAGVHDVVSVLKWGFRHLVFPNNASFSGSPTSSTVPSLAFYTTFQSQSRSFPASTSFTGTLLPSLPVSSAKLLSNTLDLMSSIVAHAEENAMNSRSLSHKIGLYLFGMNNANRWKDFDNSTTGFYQDLLHAGTVLEGLLKAYLKEINEKNPLPNRLREIIGTWPEDAAQSEKKRSVRALKVELESKGDWDDAVMVNDQATGIVSGTAVGVREGKRKLGGVGGAAGEQGERKFARRDPLVILVDAVEASKNRKESQDDEARKLWDGLLSHLERDPKSLLGDETARILDLVGLGQLPLAKTPASPAVSDLPSPVPLSPSLSHRRRRSFSQDRPASPLPGDVGHRSASASAGSPFLNAEYGAFGNFPNRSVGNLGTMQSPREWNDFALQGFGKEEPFSKGEFGLLQADLAPRPSFGRTGSIRSKTLGPREGFRFERKEEPKTTVLKVELVDIDEELKEVWLDSLNDRMVCKAWPSFMISDLKPTLDFHVGYIVIVENLVGLGKVLEKPIITPVGVARAPSISESTLSRSRWNRRMSNFFSGNSGSIKSKQGLSVSTPDHGTISPSTTSVRPSLPSLPASPPASPHKKRPKQSVPTIPESPIKSSFASKERDVDAVSISSTSSRKSFIRRFSVSKKSSKGSLKNGALVPDVPTIPDIFSRPSLDSVPARSTLPVSHAASPPVVASVITAAVGPGAVKAVSKPDTSKALPKEPVVGDEDEPVSREGFTASDKPARALTAESSTSEAAEVEEALTVAAPEAEALAADRPREEVASPQGVAASVPEEKTSESTALAGEKPKQEAGEVLTTERVSGHSEAAIPASMEEDFESEVATSPSLQELGYSTLVEPTQASATPTFSISPPALNDPLAAIPRTVSSETVHIPKTSDQDTAPPVFVEESLAITQVEDSSATAPTPDQSSPANLASPEYQSYPMDSPTIPLQMASPSTPRKKDTVSPSASPETPSTPKLSTGEVLSPTLSTDSQPSTLGRSSAPSSPSSPSSKKFLGSKAIGGLLRRKKSTVEKPTSSVSEKAVEKDDIKALKQRQKEEKAALKKAAPVPVSSVKKRVQEIEAEAAAATAAGKVIEVPSTPVTDTSRAASPTLVAAASATSSEQAHSLDPEMQQSRLSVSTEALSTNTAEVSNADHANEESPSVVEELSVHKIEHELKTRPSEHSLAETANSFATADSDQRQASL